jgi:integrase
MEALPRQVPCGKGTTGDPESAIFDFIWKLKKDNRSADTIRTYDYSLRRLVALGVNLFDPENFVETITKETEFSEARKYNLSKAYRCFLNYNGIKAPLPKYKVNRPIPYIPIEDFLDQLIASCGNQMVTFLQTLKETAARPGEAIRIEKSDFDPIQRTLAISRPEKGCKPRIRKISNKIVHMLQDMLRTTQPDHKRIFNCANKEVASNIFRRMRKIAAQKLGNPELLRISFYTFRYWKATNVYHSSHDFGKVMVLLRTHISQIRATVGSARRSLLRRNCLHMQGSLYPPGSYATIGTRI